MAMQQRKDRTQDDDDSTEELCQMYCPAVFDHDDSRQLSFLEALIS